MLAPTLRRTRARLAAALARLIERFPAAEPAFIRAGTAVRTRPWLASLYWHSHEALTARLRATDRRYRCLAIDGQSLWLDITSYTAKLRYFHHQPYEPQLTRVVSALEHGDVFVDIGANEGLFTLIAACRVRPDGLVIAFEPHPGARMEMASLLARNGVSDTVRIVPAAVCDIAAGTGRLFVGGASELSTLSPSGAPLPSQAGFREAIAVDLTTLDTWMARSGIDPARIRLVKIDVEGAEERVLRGATATLAAAPRAAIVCETAADSAADRMLRQMGYSARALDRYGSDYANFLYERPETVTARAWRG